MNTAKRKMFVVVQIFLLAMSVFIADESFGQDGKKASETTKAAGGDGHAALMKSDLQKNDPVPENTATTWASKNTAESNAKHILFVGSSYIASAGSQEELVGAMLKSKGLNYVCDNWVAAGMGCVAAWAHNQGRMTADETKLKDEGRAWEGLDTAIKRQKGMFDQALTRASLWDFVVIDTYGSTSAPDFPEAVAGFAKQIREHSPQCKIILYSVWPGKKGTVEQAKAIFDACVEQARINKIWVATTGPALFEAAVERPDLKLHRTETDGHPGMHGGYINACSLYVIITDESPMGLPTTLNVKSTYDFPPASQEKGRPRLGELIDFVVAPVDAKYLQEFAWKIYQRELEKTRPGVTIGVTH